ncbi:MAG TPA: ATP-binding protein [Gemmatimonadaceae bacterium]|nr:ATP-binding protein [Gemmatimonadaceae bacterium]
MHIALELEIPSDVRYIERVVEIVAKQCAQFSYPQHQTSLNIPVALSEALSNAILRGNGDRTNAYVQVKVDVTQDRLILEVLDEGLGFNFEECLQDPREPDNLEREDGRGLFLMTQLMDRIERFSNQGNVVRMTLKRHD